MASVVDPAFRGQAFQSFIVAAPGLRMGPRQIAEAEMQKELAALGIPSVQWLDVFPPTRSGDPQALSAALASSGAQAVLLFQPGSRDVSTDYVNMPTQTQTTGTINQFGNTANFNASSTTTGGGFFVSKPSATDSFTVFALPSAAIAWRADADSSGSAYSSFDDLIRSAAQTAVRRLVNDGLIVPTAAPAK